LRLITIEYHRIPDRVGYLPSMLLHEDEEKMVVLNVLNRANPLMVNGYNLIDRGCTAVWLIPMGKWFDLAAIYGLDHRLRGYYCDITTPAERTPSGYRTKDLFLDLCILPDKTIVCLDEDEFQEAVEEGALDHDLVEKARRALNLLRERAVQGELLTPEVLNLLKLPENVEDIRNQVIEARRRQSQRQTTAGS
jgi:predicted RNA-binding protein associated with RNAse of E/G family